MGDGFTVQIEKCIDLEMHNADSLVSRQRVKINEQLKGTVGLTESNNK